MANVGEWAGEILSLDDLAELLARFGMHVKFDDDPEQVPYLTTQAAHALVGVAEAHASRAEERYREAGASPADIVDASLMAFAGVNCQTIVDELGLALWRITRLSGALNHLTSPFTTEQKRDPAVEAAVRLLGVLTGVLTAAHTAQNPERAPGDAASAGLALVKAVTILEQVAQDAPRLRALGQLMQVTG